MTADNEEKRRGGAPAPAPAQTVEDGPKAPAAEATLTKSQLIELERAPLTKGQRVANRVVCLLPIVVGFVAIAEYLYVPNWKASYKITYSYVWFLAILIAAIAVFFVVSLFSKKAAERLRFHAPRYTLVFALLIAYDLLTLKSGTLLYPYFPWVDDVINAGLGDWAYLLDCVRSSLILLATGYFTGALVGLLTGIACGYSKKCYYWISPFLKILGAIPSATWIPIVMVIAASLFQGSVFIIALGVWFAVAVATITGISNIDVAYYEAARTLGASGKDLVFHIAIPSAIPSIFQGLTQALSSACMALIIAEMIGVESGLGWYINWQKTWAQYDNMYAAIVVICVVFVLVTFGLKAVRDRVLRWQEGTVKQ